MPAEPRRTLRNYFRHVYGTWIYPVALLLALAALAISGVLFAQIGLAVCLLMTWAGWSRWEPGRSVTPDDSSQGDDHV